MDRLSSIEALIAAVEAGSITAAAERLAVATSVVSKRVTDLERHLGLRLLTRSPRRLALTEAGVLYYDRARRALAELAEADRVATGADAAPHGTLRVAVPVSFGTMQLKRLTCELMSRWPDLVIELDMDDRYVDLETGGYDLAVRIGPLDDTNLVARVIAPNRAFICGSPDYLARRGQPRTPEDLQDHDGLLYTYREAHGMWRLSVAGELRSYRVRTRMRCNNGELLQEAALAGLGLAILPTFMTAPHLKSGALVPVLTQYEASSGTLNAVYVRGRSVPAKVRVFIDALVAAHAPTPGWDRGLDAP